MADTHVLYEKKTYLEHGESGFFGKNSFFIIAGIGIVAMIVEPFLEQPDRLFRKIASSPLISSCLLPGTVMMDTAP